MQRARISLLAQPLTTSTAELAATLRRVADEIEAGAEDGYDEDPQFPGIIPGEWKIVWEEFE